MNNKTISFHFRTKKFAKICFFSFPKMTMLIMLVFFWVGIRGDWH